MVSDPHWTAYLSALLIPIVALIGLSIAFRQWSTARDKLKHDLFERRFSVFEVARNFCISMADLGKIEGDEGRKLSYKSSEAKWLLNQEISTYIAELLDKGMELDFLSSELYDLYEKNPGSQYVSVELERIPKPVHEEIATKRQTQERNMKWFHEQIDVLDEKFSPFLTLKH